MCFSVDFLYKVVYWCSFPEGSSYSAVSRSSRVCRLGGPSESIAPVA